MPLWLARYSHPVRIRVGLVGLLACATLVGCTRSDPDPRPNRTIEPSITESSPMPTANPDNVACDLLTADERSTVAGYSMNAEMPVKPQPGTDQCIWVQSVRQPARAAIRVVVFSTQVWLRQLVPQLQAVIASPDTNKKLVAKLEDAMEDVLADPDGLSDDQVCATYVLLVESRGSMMGFERVYYANIGAMPAAFSVMCSEGVIVEAGYGEYGVQPSFALSRAVVRLTEAAAERAAELPELADADGAGDTPEDATDGTPEPSPTETEEADAQDEDES